MRRLSKVAFFVDILKKSIQDAATMKTFIAKSNPKLKFFVEPVTDNGTSVSYVVVSQMDGYHGTEACDDWFGNQKDAEEVAAELANNA